MRILAIIMTFSLLLSGTASAEGSFSTTPEIFKWTVSAGQSLRVKDREWTEGIAIEVTRSFKEDWQASIGYVTSQVYQWQHPVKDRKFYRTVGGYAYLSAEYIHVFRSGSFIKPFVNFGLSVHEAREPLLGVNFSFITGGGVKFGDRWGLKFRHQSNGGIGKWNWGQDTVLVQYFF